MKHPGLFRFIEVGGLSKLELLKKLQQHGIFFNPLAEQLFESIHFATSQKQFRVATVEITACDLGFPRGATITAIYSKAKALGLMLCPLELAPYFRLQYLNQPEGCSLEGLQKGKAPEGSITVASELIAKDAESPQGFYLRRIQGRLWLRGYSCSLDYEWKAGDHFLFITAAV